MADILLVEDKDSLRRVLRLTLAARDPGLGNHGPGTSADGAPELLQQLNLSGTLSDVGPRALRLAHLCKKTNPAENLGVSYKTLLNKMKDYAL